MPFDYNMKEIKDKWGDVTGKKLLFKGWIHDWMFDNIQNGTSLTNVLPDGIEVKFLGKRLRTFKPKTPATVFVSGFVLYIAKVFKVIKNFLGVQLLRFFCFLLM